MFINSVSMENKYNPWQEYVMSCVEKYKKQLRYKRISNNKIIIQYFNIKKIIMTKILLSYYLKSFNAFYSKFLN